VLSEPFSGDLVRCSKHRERDRKVETGPLFPQARWREVDRESPEWPLELCARYTAPDPLLCFLAGLVRKADDRKRRHAALQMRLDLDRSSLEADESMGGGTCEHISTLRRESARNPRRVRRERAN
jgi:hypothetical protein